MADDLRKKRKRWDEHDTEITENKLKTLSGLVYKQTISNDMSSKRVAVVLSAKNEDCDTPAKTIVIMEKSPFVGTEVCPILADEGTRLEKHAENDIYSWYDCFPPPEENRIKMTVIQPATDEHLAKYSYKKQWILKETRKDYEEITKLWIDSLQMKIQWVYNILDGKDEVERIVLQDMDDEKGFVLLPDMKWDGKNADELYLLAIVKTRGLGSLRDLRGHHIPMLKNIRDKSTDAIKEKYGLSPGEMRVFFHYLPSYYHLHVHFTHVQVTKVGVNVEKANFLEDVIQNLELDTDYYRNKTFTISIPKDGVLFNVYKDAGRL